MEFDQQQYLSWLLPIIFTVAIFEIIVKTVALWKAARNSQLYWFIFLAVVNSAGVLPLLYILFFQKKRKK
ncbi:MAG: hypothetical protein A3B47_04550 [Candidatus Levybacteria bacterium RIFCSPLOWO2_01_FULL_39_24]|nr:MAG: hypothetical protein A2800_03920 [Candidatus Levybacteria bacterium RIFCSPHIGHO2_01_FULL_40_16]OGH28313.1 MAG: hypothetical protein A3E12_02470 [Candidatus Levybacteria bacterium RIFCSPHIGHO2_12_FULL_39_9]OGH46795.1 MAG: hypothetical protein A3B47_04550 [Candidatus Levybacteria bacterium RIFCSPLOWO2_01_FULL_39_24]